MNNDQPGETVTFGGAMPNRKNVGGRPIHFGDAAKSGPGAWEKRTPAPEPTIHIHQGNPVTIKTCVGWLLAVRGPNKGRSYEVYPGQNSIGRSKDCSVCITADQAVSSIQCIVGYDHVSKEYFICGSDRATAITRLDGKRLHGEQALRHGSLITLSDDGKLPDGKLIAGTVLRFVPACDDSFTWDMAQS